MLRFLRKYSSSTGVKILYGVLAALFVIWGVGAVGGERVEMVARVHGETITRRDLERATLNLQRRYEAMLKDKFSAELMRSLNVRGQALDQLIDAALLHEEAKRLGITVTDTEVVDAITKMPELQDNGRFDRDRLAAFLRDQRDRGEFESDVRRGILFDRLQALVVDGVQVSDAEVEDRYRLDHEQVRLTFVRTAIADLAAGITLTDEDLQRSLDGHADRYTVPARLRVRYIAYRPKDFTADVEPKDGEIAEYYELNKDERFASPEQVHARHILVKAAPSASEDAKAKARKKAEDLLAKVRDGGDFAALAKKNSEDTSAASGGDLGFFPRGTMTPPFEEAAFALEPGQISDVVQTPFGFHIIKVEERREAGPKPLDAVRAEVVEALKNEGARRVARTRAEAARREIVLGKTLAEAAGDRSVEETAPFSAEEPVPGLGPVPAFSEIAFALHEGETSDLVETDDAIYLLTPFERVEPHTPALAEIRDRVLDDARRDRAEAAAKERAETLLARAKEVGLEQAAKDAGAKVEETDAFDRRASTIPKIGTLANDLRTDAFTLTPEAPLAPKVYVTATDAIVAALRERIPADMSGFDDNKSSVRDTLLQQRRTSIVSAYIDHLKERARQEGALEVMTNALARG